MPWLAAAAIAAVAALSKNPTNQGTFVPSRTNVATASPGAIENTWPTASTFADSSTSSTR